ncbi:formin-2-like isoform X2 [Sorex araneus]|uniref:formin-2-like isoform X2 n=1 Tax=Sorex araneus TaxID=42254 RepID=UPI00243399E1|nr:formin-2-like isoform X2 [Sorex araneus]
MVAEASTRTVTPTLPLRPWTGLEKDEAGSRLQLASSRLPLSLLSRAGAAAARPEGDAPHPPRPPGAATCCSPSLRCALYGMQKNVALSNCRREIQRNCERHMILCVRTHRRGQAPPAPRGPLDPAASAQKTTLRRWRSGLRRTAEHLPRTCEALGSSPTHTCVHTGSLSLSQRGPCEGAPAGQPLPAWTGSCASSRHRGWTGPRALASGAGLCPCSDPRTRPPPPLVGTARGTVGREPGFRPPPCCPGLRFPPQGKCGPGGGVGDPLPARASPCHCPPRGPPAPSLRASARPPQKPVCGLRRCWRGLAPPPPAQPFSPQWHLCSPTDQAGFLEHLLLWWGVGWVTHTVVLGLVLPPD